MEWPSLVVLRVSALLPQPFHAMNSVLRNPCRADRTRSPADKSHHNPRPADRTSRCRQTRSSARRSRGVPPLVGHDLTSYDSWPLRRKSPRNPWVLTTNAGTALLRFWPFESSGQAACPWLGLSLGHFVRRRLPSASLLFGNRSVQQALLRGRRLCPTRWWGQGWGRERRRRWRRRRTVR